jgi:Glu-tRNA(Gln) amidotransferase subunit E-like FAD-binding protein
VFDVEGVAEELFTKLADESISTSAIDDVLVEYANNQSVDWSQFKTLDDSAIRDVVKQVIASDPDAPMGALMGQAMSRLSGKADGKVVSQMLREELK